MRIQTVKAGRPRTSSLSRAEQLRTAKQAQRTRDRGAGVAVVELRLEADIAARLRLVANTTQFKAALGTLLDDLLIDINQFPALRQLAWNRGSRWLEATEALALYERNWRFIDSENLDAHELQLIDRLKHRYGAGVLHV